MTRFDVIVAGGGPAGATLATGLTRQGRSVAVIEPVPREAETKPGYDDRTLALNVVSLRILRHLGLLPETVGQTPIRQIRVSRAGGFGRFELHATDFDLDRFGSVVVARELGHQLQQALDQTENITLFCPSGVEHCTVDNRQVAVTLDTGETLHAGLLVGADGSRSKVRELAGIGTRFHDYGQHALVFNVVPETVQRFTAWERFTPTGPLALLPQPAGRAGVVWIDGKARIDHLVTVSDRELTQRLKQRFGPRLGDFFQPGKRSRYPLVLCKAEQHVAQRVALIGNSATTVHPVSAQGFNLGLRDIAGLLDAVEGQTDCGATHVLQRYTQARRSDQAATVRYTDTLARSFTNPSGLIRTGVAAGLFAHALSPALQRRLVKAATGFRWPVSGLANTD